MEYESFYKPIEKTLKIDGFFMGYKPKNKAKICNRICITSYDPLFHDISKNLLKICGLSSRQVNNLLIKIDENYNAKIYVDNFPISYDVILKKDKLPFTFICEDEILDICSYSFKDVINDLNPIEGEKFICLLRIGFSFGLFFDLTGELIPDKALKVIDHMVSQLTFRESYKAFSEKVLKNLTNRGWYPFVELSENEIKLITKQKPSQKFLKNLFKENRLEDMVRLWFSKEAFKDKEIIILAGIKCFKENNYIGSIKILITEIEGLIAKAYELDYGLNLESKSKKIKEYLSKKTENLELSKLSPIEYLINSVYKKGNPKKVKNKVTRHTTAHGRDSHEFYTLERNIQIILTINQLYFYL